MKLYSVGKMKLLKRLFSLVLAVLLCVPLYALPVPVHATNSVDLPDTLTPEMAEAFADYLIEMENEQKWALDSDIGLDEECTIYAVVETLGPDNCPVLRIIKRNSFNSEEDLWIYKERKIERLCRNINWDAKLDSSDFFISEVDGINYYGIHFSSYEKDFFGDHFESFESGSYTFFTVESGQWRQKLELRYSYVWVENSNNEDILDSETYSVIEGDEIIPITKDKFNQYVGQYKNSPNTPNPVIPRELISALKSKAVISSNSSFSVEDISYTLTDEMSTYFNDLTGFVFFKKGTNFSAFNAAMADNESLFNMAEYLLDSGIIPTESDIPDYLTGEVSYVEFDDGQTYTYETSAGLRGVTCDTVNQYIERFTGRTIDFTPYQVEKMPVGSDTLQRISDNFVLSFVHDNIFYQGYTDIYYIMEKCDIQKLYQLGNNMFWTVSSVSFDDPYAGSMDYGEINAIYEKVNGDYKLVKIYALNESPSVEEMQQYAIKRNPESNFNIDYSAVANYTDLSQYIEALKAALAKAGSLNDAGNRAVTAYLDYAVQNYKPAAVYAQDNAIAIAPETVKTAEVSASEMMTALQGQLGDLSLVQAPALSARIDVSGLDLAQPIRVRLSEDAIAAIDKLDSITLVLGDNQHMITAPVEALKKLGYLDVQLEQLAQAQYQISFFDKSEELIEHLDANITFALPASSELSSIQAVYSGYSDSWGGQYDAQNKTITFQTAYSGEYTVLEKKIEIPDIDYLPEETQRAIQFMVAKGYFELDDEGRFNPSVGLNRYDFSQAAVRIFFALDRDAVTSFSDVTQDNPYYPYVASGEANEILRGYDDGAFHGDDDILRVQMLAICGRTLVNKKNYSRPGEPSDYLNYVDSSDIPEWSIGDLSLTVREGLIEGGGVLRPNQPINRGEAALILYRLFMLLYEVSPTPIKIVEAQPIPAEVETETSASVSPAVIGGIAVICCGGIGGAAYFALKKKKIIK